MSDDHLAFKPYNTKTLPENQPKNHTLPLNPPPNPQKRRQRLQIRQTIKRNIKQRRPHDRNPFLPRLPIQNKTKSSTSQLLRTKRQSRSMQ